MANLPADGLGVLNLRIKQAAVDKIGQAIERLFKKTVVAVNTCNYAGKKKRERTAAFGRQADWKKAIVTLKKGDKIELA